jgi:hypothetical protein
MPDVLFERYGLAANPFRSATRNCLQQQADHQAILHHLPCLSELRKVPDVLAAGLAARQPRFFLLSGSSGSGRTSIANCILAEYLRLSATLTKLIVPQLQTDARQKLEKDAGTVLRRWLSRVLQSAEDDDIDLSSLDPVLGPVEKPGEDERKDPAVWASNSARHIRKLHNRLTKEHKVGAAVLIDGAPYGSLVSTTAALFAGIPTVCVFTTSSGTDEGAEVKEAFDGIVPADHCHHIPLANLDGDNACLVAAALWPKSSKEPLPISEDWIRSWLDIVNLPIGGVLMALSRRLDVILAGPPSSSRSPGPR